MLDVEAMEFWGSISYLKGGINFSEKITTVSPTYAQEILTPEIGFGFDGVLGAARATISSASSTASTRTAGIRRTTRSCRRVLHAPTTRRQSASAKRRLLEAVGLPSDACGAGRVRSSAWSRA